MQQIIYFDISGLIIIVGVLVAFYLRRNIPCNKNTVYKIVIWVVFGSTCLDTVLGFLRNNNLHMPGIFEICVTTYYILHTALPCLFYIYCVSNIENYQRMNIHKLMRCLIPQIVFTFLLITSSFTKIIFYFDENGYLQPGKYHYLCYILAVLYILLMFIFVLRYRSQFKKIDTWLLSSFFILSLVPIGIQYFIPNLLVENFCAVICCLLILVTIGSNDTLVESNTMLFNENALQEIITSMQNTYTPFDLVIIKLTEIDFIFKRMGTQTVRDLSRMVAFFLRGLVSAKNVYYLNHDCFALVLNEGGRSYIDNIEERMKKPWCVNHMEIQISACCCELHIPSDVEDLEGITEYIKYMETLTGEHKNHLTVEDVNLKGRKRKLQVEDAIRNGFKHNSFQVYYQPIYSFEKNRITSAEALIRLSDPVIGFIPPDEFIPVAESSGAILEIGKFVFEEVCKFITENKLWEMGIDYVDINLSVIQCVQVDLVSHFEEVIRKYNIPTSLLCLEITETAEERTPEIIKTNIGRFRDLGIKFALDDYGTGYSNLYKVITLPFSVVKFDKHMVWTALANEKAKLALESEINAMKKMNMKVVAEGVENREQLMELRRMNSDFIQGYYFSKALPGNEFIKFIKEAGEDVLQYVDKQ